VIGGIMPEDLLPENPTIKTAGTLSDDAYAQLAITYADTPSKEIPVVAGSREQQVANARLICEKQKAEDQEALRKEVDALDLSKAHIRKSKAFTADVVYEVRLFDIREPNND
jgi:hypothetical protein